MTIAHRSNVFYIVFFRPWDPKPSRNFSKGFQLKIDGFSIPGRSRPCLQAPAYLLVVLRNHERQRFLLRLEMAELCAEVVVLGSELRNLVVLGFY